MTHLTQKLPLWLRRAAALGLAIWLAGANVPPAAAHATLLRSDPPDNAVLPSPPTQIRLWFSEAISPEFSTVQILDINNQPVKPTAIRVDSQEPGLMIITLPKLPHGLYSLRWQVLSETDGHFTHGPLVFGVGQNISPTAAAPAAAIIPPLPEVILRWLNLGALLGLVGAAVVAYNLLVPGQQPPPLASPLAAARRRVLAWGAACAALALVAGLGLLGWQLWALLDTLPESATAGGAAWALLAKTRWGWLWLARQGSLLAAGIILFQSSRRPRRLMPIILAVLLPVILALQAMAGHAAGLARHTALALVVDTLHLLAASVWVGGLLALTVGLLPLVRRNRTDFSALAHAGWGRFGRWAAASVAVLFATGLYSAGRQVTSVDALLTTLYGQTLLVKMGLVLGVGLIGLTNATLLHPILARLFHLRLSLRPLPRLVSFEIGLGLLVIMATGLLTASPQANGPEFGPTNAELPQSLSQTAHDMVITFGAKPNRPGQNVFTIRAASTRRPAPAEVMRVMVRLTYLAQDIGRVSVDAVEVEPGLYQVGGNYFSAAGPWQVNVVARRRGVEDVTATFNWVVPPVGSGRAPFISSRPLEPGLTTAAALLLLALAAFLLGLAARRAGMEMWPLRKLTNFLTGFRLNIKTFAPIPVPKEKENR